jgi:hypothetical protein
MLKKASIVVSCFLLAAFIAASIIFYKVKNPASNDMVIGNFASAETVSFEKAIEISDCIFLAAFLSYKEKNGYVEYTFEVNEVLRGNVSERTIHLVDTVGETDVAGTSYERGRDIYTVGEDYLLLTQRNDSLFYDYPLYVPVAGAFIPVKELGASAISGKPVSVDEINAFLEKARRPVINAQAISETKNYLTSDDLKAVTLASDLVLEVKINALLAEGIYNGNPYNCTVVQSLKGAPVNTIEGTNDIILTLLKGSVALGETYVVMVNRIEETSVIYTQSAKNGVIPSADTKTVDEVKRLISTAAQ